MWSRNYATILRAIDARNQLFCERIVLFTVGRPGASDAKKVNYAENEQICRDSNDHVQSYPVPKIWRLFGRAPRS
jgi:hypothetical protein